MSAVPTILAVGAHTDDIELGCGATIARYIREGAEVHCATFSRAELSVPEGLPEDTLELEHQQAMRSLGVTNFVVHRFPVRTFAEHRQSILEALLELRRQVQPDIILTHASSDNHQDHQVISAESTRAFRARTLYGYELPWNQRVSITNHFIEVSRLDLDNKIAALLNYRSQVNLGRPYFHTEYTDSIAKTRGVQSNMPYAEAFEVISSSNRIS